MNYLDKTSLANTIDNVSEALLFGLDIEAPEKTEISRFIANQHYLPHAYANTFAPTHHDLSRDLVLFTGEKVKSKAGKCHIIGEEASRILLGLNTRENDVKTTIRQADEGLQIRINEYMNRQGETFGTYCCKTCSCSLWLNLSAGGLNNNVQMLLAGLGFLKQSRNNNGSWNGFPYYYTLYVLNEVTPALAMEELKFAAGSIKKRLKRMNCDKNKFTLRRDFICRSILEKVS